MRTPALLELDRCISELNTYFALSELYSQGFWQQNDKFASESPNQLTTEAFPLNPAARQMNVPLGILRKQSAMYEQFLMQQVVSRCSEAAKDYFDWISDFCHAIFGMTRDSVNPFFEGIAAQVGVPIGQLTDMECLWTLDHLRCRRNCLVHRDGDSNSAFDLIRRQKGDALNKYWASRLAPRRDSRVDFKNPDPGKIASPTFLDLLHFTRLSAETFDKNICSQVPDSKLRAYIESEFDKQNQSKTMRDAKRKLKLKQFGLRLFDYHF